MCMLYNVYTKASRNFQVIAPQFVAANSTWWSQQIFDFVEFD